MAGPSGRLPHEWLTRKNLKDRSLEADVTLGQDAEMEGTWRHPKSKMEPET